MGLTASSLGCRKRKSPANHNHNNSVASNGTLARDETIDNDNVDVCVVLSEAEEAKSDSNLLDFSSFAPGPSSSNNVDLSDLRRDYGNYLTLASTKGTLEFVHGEKKPNTRVYGVDENGFQFHHLIDTGGFGVVFKATKKTTGVTYALKVQPMEYMARLTRAGGKRRANEVSLQMEKTVLATCHGHPFIVKLDYAFYTSLYAVLAIEYVPGGTLSRLVAQSPSGRLVPLLAKIYTAEIVIALNFMHQKGIIYRDLKPSNILVCLDGHLKLTDFGLAGSLLVKRKSSDLIEEFDEEEAPKQTSDDVIGNPDDESTSSDEPEITEDEEADEVEGDLRRVRRRTLCGTAGYRPLEMIGERFLSYSNRNGYDERVDWFSLGVTVFTMVCGRRPFPTKREMMKSGISSPSITNKRSSGDTKSDAAERAAIRKAMRDLEIRCILSEVIYPEFLDEHTDLKSFIEALIAIVPEERPRFGGIVTHPWLSDLEFDAEKIKRMDLPDWVKIHARDESKAQPKQLRRNSMVLQNKPKTDLSLNSFIKDICRQMVDTCSQEEADRYMDRWNSIPSSNTTMKFKHWNFISGDAMALELDAAYNDAAGRIDRAKLNRRATQ